MAEDRAASLLRIYASMREASGLLLDGQAQRSRGDVAAAALATGRLIDVLTKQLDDITAYDRAYPDSPFGTGPTTEQLLDALLSQGDLLETLGRRDEAEAARELAMQLSPALQTGSAVAERKRQRAASLLAQGRYHEAAIALNEARDEFGRAELVLESAQVTIDLAELYEWLGDGERAREEAARTRQAIEPRLARGTPSFGGAMAALAAGQLDEAQRTARLTAIWLDLLQVEARTARDLGDFEGAAALFTLVRGQVEASIVPAIDFQLARIDVERGEPARGLARFRALRPAMTGLLRPKLGALMSWEADALLRLDRPAEALDPARASVEELARYGDLDSLWKAQWRLGRALQATDDDAGALTAYRAAVDTVTTLRRAPLGYRLESTFMADKAPLFDDAILLAASVDDADTCLQLIEQVKSRALTAVLTVPRADREPDEHAAAVDMLSSRIDALEYQAYRQGWSDETRRERDRLLLERTRLLERIQIADPRWRSLSRPAGLDAGAVLGLLATRNQAALTLYQRLGEVVAVLLHEGTVAVDVRPLAPDSAAAVAAYGRNLEAERPDVTAFDPASVPALAADRLVPVGLLERALAADSLIVVPHRGLHLLPWAGLVTGGQRLFEQCAVGVLPNVSCLAALDTARRDDGGVALLGGPDYGPLPGLPTLPLADEEIRTIAEIFADRLVGPPRTGGAASQRGYHELIAEPLAAGGTLHLACHGDLAAGDPENSGLLLADARLDVSDIARQRVRFDDVVLSACASGFRPTRVGRLDLAGDDIVGLPGAFLEAGARTVLVSIPRARDDATLAFMTIYYEHRAVGEPPLNALRHTQRDMLAAGHFAPSLWVGFSLYGCA